MNRDSRALEEHGPTGHLLPVRVSSLILAFAAALITVFAGAMLYVGWLSSREADRQAYQSETRLFEHVLNSRFTLLARDQFQAGVFDEAVEHASLSFSQDYAIDDLVDALWNNYGLDRTLVVAMNGKPLAYAREDNVEFNPRTMVLDDDLRALIDRAVAQYRQNRNAFNNGIGVHTTTAGDRALLLSEIADIFQGAFQNIEGRPAFVSAMAIVPNRSEESLLNAPPVVLVNAKFIDTDELDYLRHQVGFHSLDFIPGAPEGHTRDQILGAHEDIVTLVGTVIGTFVWQNAQPGRHIWSAILPIVAAIGLIVAIAAMLVARRLASMSNQLESSERRTRHMSRHDALTGLANRMRFGEALSEAVGRLPEDPFAVIACDLDRFKAVNDTYGHGAGDVVICEVADRLRRAVGDAGLVSRTGGDEFILLITGYSDRRRLNLLCTAIIESVVAPIKIDRGGETDVGVSLGVAQAPLCGSTEGAIMRAADEALYAAKETGRGHAVFAELGELLDPIETATEAPAAAATPLRLVR